MSVRMGRKLAELARRGPRRRRDRRWLASIKAGRTPGTYPVGLAVVFAELGLLGGGRLRRAPVRRRDHDR